MTCSPQDFISPSICYTPTFCRRFLKLNSDKYIYKLMYVKAGPKRLFWSCGSQDNGGGSWNPLSSPRPWSWQKRQHHVRGINPSLGASLYYCSVKKRKEPMQLGICLLERDLCVEFCNVMLNVWVDRWRRELNSRPLKLSFGYVFPPVYSVLLEDHALLSWIVLLQGGKSLYGSSYWLKHDTQPSNDKSPRLFDPMKKWWRKELMINHKLAFHSENNSHNKIFRMRYFRIYQVQVQKTHQNEQREFVTLHIILKGGKWKARSMFDLIGQRRLSDNS